MKCQGEFSENGFFQVRQTTITLKAVLHRKDTIKTPQKLDFSSNFWGVGHHFTNLLYFTASFKASTLSKRSHGRSISVRPMCP